MEEFSVSSVTSSGAQSSFTSKYVTQVLVETNFVGIMLSRSVHYEFYAWYFHTLPFLVWSSTNLPFIGKVAIMLAIELCYNSYTHTVVLSVLFVATNLCLFLFIVLYVNSPCNANRTQVSTQIPNPYHTVAECNRVSRLTFIGLNVE